MESETYEKILDIQRMLSPENVHELPLNIRYQFPTDYHMLQDQKYTHIRTHELANGTTRLIPVPYNTIPDDFDDAIENLITDSTEYIIEYFTNPTELELDNKFMFVHETYLRLMLDMILDMRIECYPDVQPINLTYYILRGNTTFWINDNAINIPNTDNAIDLQDFRQRILDYMTDAQRSLSQSLDWHELST